MARVYIVGVGPGHPDYLLPVAKRTIEKSHTLIGSPRLLDLFRDLEKKEISIAGNYSSCLDYIRHRQEDEVISVLVSGDPCFYSLTKSITEKVSDYSIIPGIGSVPLAFSRAGLQWQDGIFTSVHGRSEECLIDGASSLNRPVAILTDNRHSPAWAAEKTLAIKPVNRPVWIMSNLGLSDESIIKTDLHSLAQEKDHVYPSLTVLLLEAIKS